MGQCCSAHPPPDKSILSLVRGIRPSDQSLGNARVVRHIRLWDEYMVNSPPEILGTGMNGPVKKIYSRRDPSLVYALKEVQTVAGAKGPSESTIQGLVLNELLVCLEIDHPNIARVFEVYETDTSVFLVTELCAGGELYAKLKAVNRFNEIEASFLAAQILKAVNYMHTLDIVHGDLKLENFLFSESSVFRSTLKLIDFGFSHLGAKPFRNLICGSPQYMAPEKFDRRETTSSDMWSIGVIVFMLLTGKAPFPGKTIGDFETFFKESEGIRAHVQAGLDKYSISQDGVEFLTRLLEVREERRMTAREALQHRWVSGMAIRRTASRFAIQEEVTRCMDLVVKFSKMGPLRRAAMGLIALHGLQLRTVVSAGSVFEFIDANCDGFIQPAELEAVLNLAQTDSATVFKSLDLMGDGRVNFSEFLAATEVLVTVTSGELPSSYKAIIEQVFRSLDVDNSGSISEANLFALFGRTGYKGTQNAELIKEGDFIGDGKISLDEFIKLIQHGHDEET